MRILQGTAVSTKMQKTVAVRIERQREHAKYKKKYKVSNKLLAHDPEGRVKEGDKVFLLETRPMSKRKNWVVITPERAAELRAAASAARKASSSPA
jgi:small subunit ribosomal protein S17